MTAKHSIILANRNELSGDDIAAREAAATDGKASYGESVLCTGNDPQTALLTAVWKSGIESAPMLHDR